MAVAQPYCQSTECLKIAMDAVHGENAYLQHLRKEGNAIGPESPVQTKS